MAVVPSKPLPPTIPADWKGAERLFKEVSKGMMCSDIFHVNSKTCRTAWLDMFKGCFSGSMKFFFPIYLAHTLWHSKRVLSGDKDFFKDLAYYYARSILFGASMGTTFIMTACTICHLAGGYNFWTAVTVPGAVSGLTIFIDHIYRRRIVMNTFYNMTLQYLYKRAQISELVRRTATGEAISFMAINALLMYLLHKASTREKKTPIFWFFIPETVREPGSSHEKKCPVPHRTACWTSAMQSTAKYSALAAAVQAIRIIMSRGGELVQSPVTFIKDFISRKTLAGVMSIGGYVFLYKIVRCALGIQNGSDRCEHSAFAGLLAGTTYWLQPNMTILTSSLIASIRLLHDYSPKQLTFLAQWPMGEIFFAICNGILFHARCMDMAHCPKFMTHIMDTATHDRAKRIYQVYLHHISELQLRT